MKKIILAFIVISMAFNPAMADSKTKEKMSGGEAALRVIFFPLLFVGSVKSAQNKKKEVKKEELKKKPKVRQPAMVGLKEHNKKIKKENQPE